MFKFNIDGAMRGNLGLAGIGGVLWNSKGEILFMFSKHQFVILMKQRC